MTRKIRLHEGMIISDVKVGEEKQTVDITDSDDITEEYNDKKEVSANEKKAHSNKNIDFKYASFFARLNSTSVTVVMNPDGNPISLFFQQIWCEIDLISGDYLDAELS